MGSAPTIIALAEVDSTNDEARRRSAAGEAPPFWVRAERQSAGRGRRGRAWVGLDGNLFITGVFHLACPPAEAAQLAFAAGLAVAETLDAWVAPERVALKWPNDVLLDGRKVAGVLLEASDRPRGLELLVGVGINLAAAPAGVAPPAISVAEAAGAAPSADEAGARLAAAFERWREIWARDDFAPVRAAWRARARGLGELVTVHAGAERVAGVFDDLDADGALVLTTETGVRRLHAGDVFFGGDTGVG